MTLDDKNILVTGGTGSFGKKFITIINNTIKHKNAKNSLQSSDFFLAYTEKIKQQNT